MRRSTVRLLRGLVQGGRDQGVGVASTFHPLPCPLPLLRRTPGSRQLCTEPPPPDAPEPLVLVDRLEGLHIMTIGINRPNQRNAVDTDTSEALKVAFQDFEADEDMHIAVLHGLGGNFCSGRGETSEPDAFARP